MSLNTLMDVLTSSSSSSFPSPNVQHFLTSCLINITTCCGNHSRCPFSKDMILLVISMAQILAPPNMISDLENLSKTKPNIAYMSWQKQDQLLLSWLITSLTKSIHTKVIGMSTSKAVWIPLEKHFSSQS